MVVFSWAVVSFCIELFCVVTLQYQILVRIAIAYFIIEKKNAVNTKKKQFVKICFYELFVFLVSSANLNFINSRIKNSIYVYCPVNYFKFLTKNTCLSIEFKLCFCKFFCKEIFMNISPVCKTSVSFPFLVNVFL